MKSLKESIANQLEESIISSNNVGIISKLKDILTHNATKKSLDDLNRIWKILKLDVEGFSWQLSTESGGFYIYNNSKRSNADVGWNEYSILVSGSDGLIGDIVIIKDNLNVPWTRQQSVLYKNKLIEKLNMRQGQKNYYYYPLNFN